MESKRVILEVYNDYWTWYIPLFDVDPDMVEIILKDLNDYYGHLFGPFNVFTLECLNEWGPHTMYIKSENDFRESLNDIRQSMFQMIKWCYPNAIRYDKCKTGLTPLHMNTLGKNFGKCLVTYSISVL